MVKKLLKHEIASYFKLALLINGILLSVGAFTRIVQFFESDTVAYQIVSTSSIIALCVAMVVSLVLSSILVIVRFYKNMYTNEGYLTLTLPVSHTAHIFSKLLCGIAFILINLAGIILTGMVATAGEVCAEVFKAIFYLLEKFIEATGVHGGFYIAEFIVFYLVSLVYSLLLIYLCITVGQLAKKARIILAIAVYYAYYVICQTIGTVFIIVISVNEKLVESVAQIIAENPLQSIHVFMISAIVLNSLLSVAYFFGTKLIMKNKLNLE